MAILKFEDIIAWKKAREFNFDIYKTFSSSKDYSFKDQIQRASVSISNNIAEGFDRNGNKEFIKFLYISRASCGEVKSMLYLAKDLDYLDDNKFKSLYEKANKISRLINGFIKSLY